MTGRHLTWALLIALASVGCGASGDSEETPAQPADSTAGAESAEGLGLLNERRSLGGLITGGQPTPEVLEAAAAAGVTTVISLRQESEPGYFEEQEQVRALGMRFVSIPIDGAAAITEENAAQLHRALEGLDVGSTVLHCGSGNRAGALLALRQFYFAGATRDEALEAGRAAGMTGLESVVVEHLDGECEMDPDPDRC